MGPDQEQHAGSRRKILSLDRLLQLRESARLQGRAVVQCHGCFDIVHPGHVRHLRQARAHGDVLLVSITGDGHYAKRGGAPLIPEDLRAENLAELDCVDWVHVDDAATAETLLSRVKPDVYVKGREYEHNHDTRFLREREIVERGGGRVVFSSGDVVFSSTALIRTLEQREDPYHARVTQLARRDDLGKERLGELLGGFRGKRVLVIGEVIRDVYVHCDQPEVASESPVLTLRPLERREYDGGAAIIARHAAALGAKPLLLTGLPQDSAPGAALTRRLEGEGVEVRSVPTDAPAVAEKQRYLVGAQKVMKINALERIVLDATRTDRLVGLARDLSLGCDAAIIADFGNGLLTPATVERLCAVLRPRVGTLAGDVSGKRSALGAFRDADLLTPSESEVREAMRRFDDSIPAVAWSLMELTRSRALLLTMGAEGMIAFEPREGPALLSPEPDANRSRLRSEHVPALCGYPVDPLGCGDALLTASTLALACGAPLITAAFVGAAAAAVEAQRLGNVPVSASDLRGAIARVRDARLTGTLQTA